MAKRPKRAGPTFIQRSRGESSEQKAIWHNVTGAGRSQVVREFFGLDDSDHTAVRDAVETLLARRLEGSGT